MRIYHISYPIIERNFNESVLAIGFFDGVHMGHQQVINKAKETAKEKKLQSSVMTFTPHPLEVIGNKKIDYITPIKTKINILQDMNIDICYIVEFTKGFADISPDEFIDNFLMRLNIKSIVVGFDFSFGKMGIGNPEKLKELSSGRYSVDIIEQYSANAKKISSTRIREKLLQGNLKEANCLLGRNFVINGQVIDGDKRGRTIGFPTANVELQEDFVPIKNGVYIVNVLYKNKSYLGVMNVGKKPTFSQNNLKTIEIHILDFAKDIYGEIIEVEVLDFMRDERKFNSVDELIMEITNDIKKARNYIFEYKV